MNSFPTTAVQTPLPPSPTSFGEMVNFAIDSVLATLQRLLDLPLFVVVIAAALLGLAVFGLLRKRQATLWVRAARLAALLLVVAALVFVFDYRAAQLQDQVHRLRAQATQSTAALLEALAKTGGRRREPLFDRTAAEASLLARFGSVRLRSLVVDDAIDVVQLHLDQPLVEAWLCVADLQHQGLELAIDGRFDFKTFTSDFARRENCLVAINGEAGNSPRPGCGLAPWQGNLVIRGVGQLQELPDRPLPFLAFDGHNHATYTAGANKSRGVPPEAFHVIWGRIDCIVDGEVQRADFRLNQPRTVMGIDREGRRLFLLVVDGRQMKHSWGLTRAEAGDFLQAFGVHNAMLCDEGGSSCMYVAPFGGIVNVPSDNDGEERPTYTHFGLVISDDASRRR